MNKQDLISIIFSQNKNDKNELVDYLTSCEFCKHKGEYKGSYLDLNGNYVEIKCGTPTDSKGCEWKKWELK